MSRNDCTFHIKYASTGRRHVTVRMPKKSFLMSCELVAEMNLRLRPGEVIAEYWYQSLIRVRSSRNLRRRLREYAERPVQRRTLLSIAIPVTL